MFRHLKQQPWIHLFLHLLKSDLNKEAPSEVKYLFVCLLVCVWMYLSVYLVSNLEYLDTQESREHGSELGKESRCALGTSPGDVAGYGSCTREQKRCCRPEFIANISEVTMVLDAQPETEEKDKGSMSCHLQNQTPVQGSAAVCCISAGHGSQQPGSIWAFPGATQNLPRACCVWFWPLCQPTCSLSTHLPCGCLESITS